MKKILLLLLVLSVATLTSCMMNNNQGGNHGPSANWKYDENGHWKPCTVESCNDKYTERKHSYGEWYLNEDGEEEHECSVCGYIESKNEDSTTGGDTNTGGDSTTGEHEHNYSSKWSKNDTYHWHACNGCNVPSEKEEHKWDNGVVQKEATYAETGKKVFTCSVCEQTKIEEIPALEHTHDYSTEFSYDVNSHWYECLICKGHKDEENHSYTNITDKNDTQERTCSVCQYFDVRPITDVWDGNSVSENLIGNGTETDPYQIHSGADLAYFKNIASTLSGKYVKLMRNIDLNGANFIVPVFDGVLDGDNRTIKGLNVIDWETNGVGLFRTLSANGVIKNLTLEGSITGFTLVGSFAGKSLGTIINCTSKVNIKAEWTVGGIAAEANGLVENCVNYGNITNGKANCGGIVGDSKSTVKNCVNYGNISSINWAVGGVVGLANAEVINCTNNGEVYARGHIGGVVGRSISTVTNCINNGKVAHAAISEDKGALGGIVGDASGIIDGCENNGLISALWGEVGGVAGWAHAEVKNSKNNATGRVLGGGWSIGGIAGFSDASITNCYNYAIVSGTNGGVGGIAGEMVENKNTTINLCENHGTISGKWNVGGIVGYLRNNTVSNSKNLGSVNASGQVGGIAGLVGGGTASVCTNSGKIVAYVVTAGGIFGKAEAANPTITNCTNSAAVESFGTEAGQIVGAFAENISANETGSVTTGSATADVNTLSLSSSKTNTLSINHRGYCFEAPENTLSAYRLSKEKGFSYVECDVNFTKDGIPVLLHDSSIDRTSDGSGEIRNLTYAEASKFDYSYDSSNATLEAKFTAYRGEKLPTFDEFIALCKELGLHPYIEIKDNPKLSDAEAKVLVDIVAKYDMLDNVSWISFDIGALEKVTKLDPTARIGWVLSTLSEDSTKWNHIDKINLAITGKNDVFIDIYYTNANATTVETCLTKGVTLEVWCIDKAKETELLNIHPYVSGVSSNDMIAADALK